MFPTNIISFHHPKNHGRKLTRFYHHYFHLTNEGVLRQLQEMSLLACYKGGQRAPQLQETRLEIEEEGKKPTHHDFSVQRFLN